MTDPRAPASDAGSHPRGEADQKPPRDLVGRTQLGVGMAKARVLRALGPMAAVSDPRARWITPVAGWFALFLTTGNLVKALRTSYQLAWHMEVRPLGKATSRRGGSVDAAPPGGDVVRGRDRGPASGDGAPLVGHVAHANQTYGALGAAVGLCLWLHLVGRLAVASAVLNATLWGRRTASDRDRRSEEQPAAIAS